MERRWRLAAAVLLALGLTLGLLLHSQAQRSCTKQIFAMDTIMSFTAYGRNCEKAVNAAAAEVQRLDALLSTGLADSEIFRANADGRTRISEDTAAILTEALSIWEETGGLFDITIYPLVDLWGFYTHAYHVPSGEELEEALAFVDAGAVQYDEADRLLTLGKGQKIDFGGIAKGYASGKAMEVFRENGVKSGMVSLGGNTQTLGRKPDGSGWRIGIRDPLSKTGAIIGVLAVEDKAVITSGGYERYFEEGGRTYIHILNPLTGYPADEGLLSVSVISENGMLADALSTSLYLMGKDRAAAYWRAHKDEFDMILIDDDEKIYVTEPIAESFECERETETIYF